MLHTCTCRPTGVNFRYNENQLIREKHSKPIESDLKVVIFDTYKKNWSKWTITVHKEVEDLQNHNSELRLIGTVEVPEYKCRD
jgi:hypothetical protein